MDVKGVIFDMDGVIVEQELDFAAIKQEIFGSTEGYILERMADLAGAELARAERILERHETVAAEGARPLDGVHPLFAWLGAQGMRTGLVTRNSRKSVEIVLRRLGLSLDAVVTREDAPPKPSPEPILLACRRMGVVPSEAVFVGDFEFDMLAGRRAGVATILLANHVQRTSENADRLITSLSELPSLLTSLPALRR